MKQQRRQTASEQTAKQESTMMTADDRHVEIVVERPPVKIVNTVLHRQDGSKQESRDGAI